VIKGRANYPTQRGLRDDFGYEVDVKRPEDQVTCADCNWNMDTMACNWCDSKRMCPYVMARTQAERAPLAVLNTSYLLTDTTKGSGRFGGRDLYILDEADKLEDELLNHVEVTITERQMARMELPYPKRRTVESEWLAWVNQVAVPGIRSYLDGLPDPNSPDAGPREIRQYNRVENMLGRTELLAKELPEGGWVYDGYTKQKFGERNAVDGKVIFRPIRVNRFGNSVLWNQMQGGKFLLMSASILSGDLMVDELGICYERDRQHTLIDLPSSFPVENRVINVAPIADMVFKNKAVAWPQMAEGIRGVLRLHPDDRVLVHCVSYELSKYLETQLLNSEFARPIITYLSSIQKESALGRYKKHPNSVLLAASMDRGIDLPHDLCRVQVIAKVPYPNVADKRISARMHSKGGQGWYRMQTVRSVIQMTGRGVRSRDDYATTYILDSQFASNLYPNGEHLFPKWWKDALNWRFNKRKLVS
jgi:Rad3-related DNA helicase